MREVEHFPENPFDYLKQYEFKDTEEIYTNGSMLIPSFRVVTMLTHYKQALLDEIVEELKTLVDAPKTESQWNNGWITASQIAIDTVKEKGALKWTEWANNNISK